jgi:transcriptional regulator with GAF, ATPase, and Fis domain
MTSRYDTAPADHLVIGRSAKMRAVFDFVDVISRSESTVLITGESGTGKEVIAGLIHHTSRRKAAPFVPVSCALFSETLIESELFGHERGAFTGAIKDRPGRFELAQGGTIFLDDIDDVPLGMQVKLLRVIQNRTIERLGGTRLIPVNVRVLAGTKRDLRQLVAEGRFREDLYYRLNVLPLTLPPLRERPEDIPPLMEAFLERFFSRRGDPPPALSPAVVRAFTAYSWPGNVRELENACERIAQMNTCGEIRVGCVAASLLLRAAEQSQPVPQPPVSTVSSGAISLDDRLRSRRHGRARETENEAGLYSSHYLDASLSLTWLLDVDAGEDPAIDVVYINRSRVDAFGGAFGRLARSVASSRQRDGMLRELKALRDRLESEFSSRH